VEDDPKTSDMATQNQYYTENGDDLVEDFSDHAPQGYDPGIWLFSGTAILVMVQFMCCMPILVWITRKLKAKKREAPSFQESLYQKFQYLSPLDKAKGKSWKVPKLDKESRYLLLYSIPFAIYSVGHALMENACLVMVGNFIGSKELAAYVLTILLTDLSGQFLRGVIHANTTLCAQAIGANNYHLAGQYIQLSITLYLAFSIPIAFFWSAYMKSLILQLDWGDDTVANYAHDFVNIYIWSQVADSMHLAMKLILDVVGKEVFSAIIGLIEEALNTLFIATACLRGWKVSLQMVAWIYLVNACTFTFLTLAITASMGWLQPFREGILQWFAIFVSLNRICHKNLHTVC
jgi:O-antigen/teichoic acid export membrane protein